MTVVERERVQTEVTVREVLHRAADLLEEFGWCQNTLARTDAGQTFVREPIEELLDNKWTSFCVVGACIRARIELGAEYTPIIGGPAWNNEPGRTRAEVVARLREAAEAAA